MDINKAVYGVFNHRLMEDFETKLTNTYDDQWIAFAGKTTGNHVFFFFTIEAMTSRSNHPILGRWIIGTVCVCGPYSSPISKNPIPKMSKKKLTKKSPTKSWSLKILIIPHDVPKYITHKYPRKTSILLPLLSAI